MTKRKIDKESCLICKDDIDSIWIQCNACSQWYHIKCLNISKSEVASYITYHCPDCVSEFGSSINKRRSKRTKTSIDYVALNEGDTFAVDKTIHPHVPSFHEFTNEFAIDSYVDIKEDLTQEDMLQRSGVSKPLLVKKANLDRLGMQLPEKHQDITISYITDQMSEDTPVEVMDVLTQQSVKPSWTMGKWKEYFVQDPKERDRIRNVISLEISQSDQLGKNFKRPRMVEQLDLVDKVWPSEFDGELKFEPRPQITKYCLMSVQGSFTDFHIDFGGTSVYYTVCTGEKTFLMFPPTERNLYLYKQWCLEQNQNFIWYPEYNSHTKKGGPSGGFKITLQVGDVFIIPSGWIHCVYTPSDSIVIGGNFITLKDMEMQLKINRIEKETKVPQKFRFPFFNKVLWLTAWYYMKNKKEWIHDCGEGAKIIENEGIKKESFEIQDINEPTNIRDSNKSNTIEKLTNSETSKIEKSVSQPQKIAHALINQLKDHLHLSKTSKVARNSIPTSLIGNPEQFLQMFEQWSQIY